MYDKIHYKKKKKGNEFLTKRSVQKQTKWLTAGDFKINS